MKIGQVNLSYVGTKYKTPKGGTLTVIGESGRRRGKNIIWEVECSICSQDKELFPAPFDGNKFQMDKGQRPCACSPYQYTEDQNKIRLSRVGLIVLAVNDKKYYVEDIDNKVCYSGTVSQLMKGYKFEPIIPLSLQVKPKKIESENSNRLTRERCEDEFYELAKLNGFKVIGKYETAHKNVKVMCPIGHITAPQPAGLKYRDWSCRECVKSGGYRSGNYGELYILRSDDNGFYKVGISNNAKVRISGLRNKTPFTFSVIAVFGHQDGSVVMSAEKKMHKMFESANLSGFDGATEWLISDGSITDIPPTLGLKY